MKIITDEAFLVVGHPRSTGFYGPENSENLPVFALLRMQNLGALAPVEVGMLMFCFHTRRKQVSQQERE